MKRKLWLFVKSILFIALVCGMFFAISLVVERKSSYEKNELFMQEAAKDNIDVFILGSSHVINGINPLQLYRDYGITAYNLGGYGSVHLSSYWQMMLALDYCTPKLVVVDSYMLENNIRYIDDENANVDSDELHLFIDRFPLSKTKIDAINDMFGEEEKKYPFLVDYIVYHDRWKELGENDFKRLTGDSRINKLMGAEMKYGIHAAEFTYNDYGPAPLPEETVGTTYLRKIIEECQSRGIEVIVMTAPYLAMQEGQQASRSADKIASEYGVHSLNMLKAGGIVDYNTDMLDAGHLNILGATKATKRLGDYISKNIGLPDHRNEAGYETWAECVEEYDQSLGSRGYETLYNQLLMLQLNQKDENFVISIRGSSMVYSDEILLRMLRSLGAYGELDRAVENRKSYILISDHGEIYECAGDFDEEVDIHTSDGTLTYIAASDIYRIMFLNGDTDNNLLYNDSKAYADIQVLFFEDEKLAAHQYYTSDHFDYEYDAEQIEEEEDEEE
jgi:hypothetical protein